MKKIGSIHIDQAPLGMMIFNKKDNRFYIAKLDKNGNKQWEKCLCSECQPHTKQCSECQPRESCESHKSHKQKGGANTDLAPSPEQHSWHHHHSPFYQVYNDYVCLKRDTLGELRDFFFEMFSTKNWAKNAPPFSFK